MKKILNNIKPISNLSLVDKVEIRLMELITGSDINFGDEFPNELELAESLGVSRTVVREAVLRLRMLGLLESKKHKGITVKRPDILKNLDRLMDPKLLDDNTLKDIFEMRLVHEVGMADFIFSRITKEDIEELEMIIEQGKKYASNPSVFNIDDEMAFHGKLYQIAQNNTLKRFSQMLFPVFEAVYLSFTIQQAKKFEIVTHKDLLDEIKFKTPESFRTKMRTHLDPHFYVVLKKDNEKAVESVS